jgi:lipoate-protein ligase A
MMSWSVQHVSAPAAVVHGGDLAGPRRVYVIESPGTAVVLGSRQSTALLDRDACVRGGVEVVVRRSGGGIVYLPQSQYVWIDVVIDRADPLWTDDVRRSMFWIGETWRNALIVLGVGGCRLHEGPVIGGALGELVCFAGVGPGEVVTAEGAKVVGIAQRRTRDLARFQCTVMRRWEPEELVALLADKDLAAATLRQRVQVVEDDPAAIVAAFVQSLPARPPA